MLMENRNGIAVNGCVTQADGRAEPQAALAMVEEIPGEHRVTLEPIKAMTARSSFKSCATTR